MTYPISNSDINKIPSVPSTIKCGCITGLKVRTTSKGFKTFYLYYDMDGKTYKYKLGKFGDIGLPEANKKAKKLRAEIVLGINPRERDIQAKKAGITLRRYLDEHYYKHADSHQKASKRTRYILEHNFKDAMNLRLEDINIRYVEGWRQQKLVAGKMPSTINRALTSLKAVLNSAVRWEFIPSSGLKGLSKLKLDSKGVVRYLSKDEEKSLMEALDVYSPNLPYIKVYIILLLYTGLRPNEAMQLKWTDIDLVNDNLTVQAGYSKSGQTRNIPINDKLKVVLEAWDSGSIYLFPRSTDLDKHIVSVQKPWDKIRDIAKLENFRMYDLRHSFASKLVMNGADLYGVKELLGHSSIEMTQIYAHLSDDYLKSIIDLL